MSVALQIRDVPEDVRDALAELARKRGQSMQGFLLALVTQESRFAKNLALLGQFNGRSDGVTSPTAVRDALDRARADRDDRNMDVGQ